MKDKLKKIKDNKALKMIGDIIYFILFIVVLLMLLVVVMQRTADNSLSLAGYRMFTVITESMVPKYEVGDVLISKEVDSSTLEVEDDIVYKGKEGDFKDRIVTHQIISIESNDKDGYNIVTKGIANTEQDPQITDKEVYGKIIYKSVILSFFGKLIKNLYLFYFIIFIPIALIIFKQIKNIISDDDDDNEKNKEDKNE